MSLKSQTLVYGLHYCYCSKFLFALINKYFYYKINNLSANKINCRLKYFGVPLNFLIQYFLNWTAWSYI